MKNHKIKTYLVRGANFMLVPHMPLLMLLFLLLLITLITTAVVVIVIMGYIF